MNQHTNHIFLCCCMLACLLSCSKSVDNPVAANKLPDIYPDYIGVTIPAGIAPMNFCLVDEQFTTVDVVATGSKGGEIHVQGEFADFDIDDWHQLTEANKGGSIKFVVCGEKNGKWLKFNTFEMFVSPFALDDYGLTYRRIPPGYEVGGPEIGIFQRDIHSFDELPILTERAVPGHCMNCHTPNRTDPSLFTSQLRGQGGGTLIQKDGKQIWLNTRTDSLKAAGSYAYWHPSGKFCAYAMNAVHQSFFVGTDRRIEAYHSFSDIAVLDTDSYELLVSPMLVTEDLEIFPAFSHDGKWLYYSTSKPCRVPAEYEKVKCSLCRLPFDADSAKFTGSPDTLINARETLKSATLARPSYDGKWLVYCLSERSNFPVFQDDADLWIMNLADLSTRPLDEVNSRASDSYHNWSSDSHWMVFSSKRENGVYAQLFITSVGSDGKATKPFLLPQRNPRKFYSEIFDSYNVPDFTKTKVEFDAHEAHRNMANPERINVKIRQ